MPKNNPFTPDFKKDVASLVVDQGYTYRQACEATGVSESAIGRWAGQLRAERASNLIPETSISLKEKQGFSSIKTNFFVDWLSGSKRISGEWLCNNRSLS